MEIVKAFPDHARLREKWVVAGRPRRTGRPDEEAPSLLEQAVQGFPSLASLRKLRAAFSLGVAPRGYAEYIIRWLVSDSFFSVHRHCGPEGLERLLSTPVFVSEPRDVMVQVCGPLYSFTGPEVMERGEALPGGGPLRAIPGFGGADVDRLFSGALGRDVVGGGQATAGALSGSPQPLRPQRPALERLLSARVCLSSLTQFHAQRRPRLFLPENGRLRVLTLPPLLWEALGPYRPRESRGEPMGLLCVMREGGGSDRSGSSGAEFNRASEYAASLGSRLVAACRGLRFHFRGLVREASAALARDPGAERLDPSRQTLRGQGWSSRDSDDSGKGAGKGVDGAPSPAPVKHSFVFSVVYTLLKRCRIDKLLGGRGFRKFLNAVRRRLIPQSRKQWVTVCELCWSAEADGPSWGPGGSGRGSAGDRVDPGPAGSLSPYFACYLVGFLVQYFVAPLLSQVFIRLDASALLHCGMGGLSSSGSSATGPAGGPASGLASASVSAPAAGPGDTALAYYSRDQWAAFSSGALRSAEGGAVRFPFREIDSGELDEAVRGHGTLGVSKLYFAPKPSGFRPISNMSRSWAGEADRICGRRTGLPRTSVNFGLRAALAVLRYEIRGAPPAVCPAEVGGWPPAGSGPQTGPGLDVTPGVASGADSGANPKEEGPRQAGLAAAPYFYSHVAPGILWGVRTLGSFLGNTGRGATPGGASPGRLHCYSSDVRAAFDTVDTSLLLRFLQKVLGGRRYSLFPVSVLRPGARGRRLAHLDGGDVFSRAISGARRCLIVPAVGASGAPGFPRAAGRSGRPVSSGTSGPTASAIETTGDEVLAALRSFLLGNIFLFNGRLYLQTGGIPQGGSVSMMLCNIYYSMLELYSLPRTALRPPSSALVRYIDDWLFLSRSRSAAAAFEAYLSRLARVGTAVQKEGGTQEHGSPEQQHDRQTPYEWCGWVLYPEAGFLIPDFGRWYAQCGASRVRGPMGRVRPYAPWPERTVPPLLAQRVRRRVLSRVWELEAGLPPAGALCYSRPRVKYLVLLWMSHIASFSVSLVRSFGEEEALEEKALDEYLGVVTRMCGRVCRSLGLSGEKQEAASLVVLSVALAETNLPLRRWRRIRRVASRRSAQLRRECRGLVRTLLRDVRRSQGRGRAPQPALGLDEAG